MARRNSTKSPASLILVKAPPPEVQPPPVPAGFIPTHRTDYRGAQPRLAELAVLPDCVLEIRAFADYAGVFGKTAPPADHVAQAIEAAGQWSVQRRLVDDLAAYIGTQEGMAWKSTRGLLEGLKASFELASSRDVSLVASCPSLARLFSIAKETAKKATATKKRKVKAKADSPAKGLETKNDAPAVPVEGRTGGLLN